MGVFTMPSLGADMEAGTLVEWLVQPGDTVSRGDVIAVVETQKGAIEVEVFEDGVVQDLMAELGATLPVGTPLARIGAEGAPVAEKMAKEAPATNVPAAPEREPPGREAAPPASGPSQSKPQPAPPPRPKPSARARPAASPAARAKAAELGVDLSVVTGTGPGGAVVLEDVEQARAPAQPLDPAAEMRRAIAAAMVRSKREIPHFYLSTTIDLEAATAWLAAYNEVRTPDDRLLLGTLFAKAAALAAAQVRQVNGHYIDATFVPADTVNLGIAISLRGGGLVAPAISDAQNRPLPELMLAMKDMVSRARAARLRSSELTSGTLTLSSLGETGANEMIGVIHPPQVALLCLGAPRIEPRATGDGITPRRVVTASLSADHRVSDGRTATRFLTAFDAHLQTPEEL